MLAFATGIPEFALDESKGEHEKLARAAERVARHYNIPALDPVTRDWIMLAKTAGIIYGSRTLAYLNRTSAQRAAPAARAVPQPRQPETPAAPVAPPKANQPEMTWIDIPGWGRRKALRYPDGRIEYMQ
jgi:hypothetical protein